MWVWTEEGQLHTNELQKKLLVAKDKDGFTALQYAAHKGSLESLETLWSWAKE
jgi:ankyrin repeat protein